MSKKNELKDYILFFKRLSAERSLIADCKVGKIDCGVTSSFLLARERILDELENQFYKTGKIPVFWKKKKKIWNNFKSCQFNKKMPPLPKNHCLKQ